MANPQSRTHRGLPQKGQACNNPQKQARTHQHAPQNHHPQENPAPELPPLSAQTYNTVAVGILFYGICTANLHLLYISFLMAAALLGPSVLNLLVSKILKK